METNSLQQELDEVLHDLNRINLMVYQKEKDLAKVKDIYITHEGTQNFSLHIDQNVFDINQAELKVLIEQLKELDLWEKELD